MLSEHTHILSPCWLPNIQRNVPLYSLTASFTFLRLRMGTSKFSLKFTSNNNATTVNGKIILYSRSQIHGSILKDMAVKRLQTVTHASCLHHLLTPPPCPPPEQRADVSTSFLWVHLWQPIHTPHTLTDLLHSSASATILPLSLLGESLKQTESILFIVASLPSLSFFRIPILCFSFEISLFIFRLSSCCTFCRAETSIQCIFDFSPSHHFLPKNLAAAKWIYEGLRLNTSCRPSSTA